MILLLHGDWQLPVRPASLITTLISGVCHAKRFPLLGRDLTGIDTLGVVGSAVHNLGSEFGSVFLALLAESLSSAILHVFSLSSSDIAGSWFGVSIIILRNLLALLFEHPIVLVVVIVATLIHQVLENLPHVVIVGPLLELEVPAVLQERVEFLGQASSQRLDGGLHLLVLYSVILVVLILALETLPRQTALQEVNENETDTF